MLIRLMTQALSEVLYCSYTNEGPHIAMLVSRESAYLLKHDGNCNQEVDVDKEASTELDDHASERGLNH